MIELNYIKLSTQGKQEIIDITPYIQALLQQSDLTDGQILVFIPGSTGALSTIEFEPGLLKDFPEFMEKLIPHKKDYYHNQTWHDGNGFSHLRATLMGPSLTIPFQRQQMLLGTWQQIVFLEFDNRPRERNIVVQLMGE